MTARTCSAAGNGGPCNREATHVLLMSAGYDGGTSGGAMDICAECAARVRLETGTAYPVVPSPFCPCCGAATCDSGGDGYSCPWFCAGRGDSPKCGCEACVEERAHDDTDETMLCGIVAKPATLHARDVEELSLASIVGEPMLWCESLCCDRPCAGGKRQWPMSAMRDGYCPLCVSSLGTIAGGVTK